MVGSGHPVIVIIALRRNYRLVFTQPSIPRVLRKEFSPGWERAYGQQLTITELTTSNGTGMASRVKLLITISELIYSSQFRNLHDLVSLIDRSIFDIEVGALATGNEAQKDIEQLDIPVYRLRLQPTRGWSFGKTVDLFKGPFVIARKRPDLVHSLLYQSFFTEPFLFKTLTSAKYIFTKSNLEWANHPQNWRLKCKYADRIISISSATDDLLDNQGFGDKKAKIFLGIDTQRFKEDPEKRVSLRGLHGIPEDALVFGCAAQFVEWKEHLTALKAFEQIAERYPASRLVYCGANHRDDYYARFLEAVEASPYKGRVHLLGNLSDMPAYYSMIDVFVLPSRYETFGYVYVEAMSCGRPVIGCRAAGPLEIIDDGVTGRLINISDSRDLAAKMESYAGDVAIRTMHGEAARKRAIDLFSKETMVQKTQELYLRTVERL